MGYFIQILLRGTIVFTLVGLLDNFAYIGDQLEAGMGEINRGGLPDLDQKSRSGFFFRPEKSG